MKKEFEVKVMFKVRLDPNDFDVCEKNKAITIFVKAKDKFAAKNKVFRILDLECNEVEALSSQNQEPWPRSMAE